MICTFGHHDEIAQLRAQKDQIVAENHVAITARAVAETNVKHLEERLHEATKELETLRGDQAITLRRMFRMMGLYPLSGVDTAELPAEVKSPEGDTGGKTGGYQNMRDFITDMEDRVSKNQNTRRAAAQARIAEMLAEAVEREKNGSPTNEQPKVPGEQDYGETYASDAAA
jgi:hypothetical protein